VRPPSRTISATSSGRRPCSRSAARSRAAARGGGRRFPGRKSGLRDGQRFADVGDAGFDHVADDLALVGRREHRLAGATATLAADQRRRAVADPHALFDGVAQVFDGRFVVHVQSFTVGAFGTEEIARQRDARLAFDGQGRYLLDRVGDQRVDRQTGVGDAIDE
jgi:hypothetical protein